MNFRAPIMVVVLVCIAVIAAADPVVRYVEGTPGIEIDGILFPVRLGDEIPDGATIVLSDGDRLDLEIDGRTVTVARAGSYDPASLLAGTSDASTRPARSSLGSFISRVVALFGASNSQPQTAASGGRARVASPSPAASADVLDGYTIPPELSRAIEVLESGDLEHADRLLATAASGNRDAALDPLYAYLRASVAFELGQYARAEQLLRLQTPDPATPFFVQHQFLSAHTHLQLGNPANTLRAVALLRIEAPEAGASAEARYLRGASLAELGEIEFARQLLRIVDDEPFRDAAANLLSELE